MKEPLSQAIQSCRDTEVGLDYKPPPKQLYCDPPLTAQHRLPAIVALDLQRQPKVQPEYTLVSPSHSVAWVLNMTAPLICQHTMGKWEIIFVVDACYDDSLQVLREVILSPTCLQSGMVRARVLVQPTSVYETSSDNLGFSLGNPTHFFIELQSDMFLQERGWNRDMARPIFEYADIFSVSGRCGHGQGPGGRSGKVGRCGADVGSLDEIKQKETQDAVYVTPTNNRGPLMLRADALRALGYLDEFNFFLGKDEHDLNRRAAFNGWFAAYKYVHMYAPLDLSPQRNKNLNNIMSAVAKQEEKEFRTFRTDLSNTSCDSSIPFGEFSSRNLRQKTLRTLPPVGDAFNPDAPLPALPPLPQ
jgi:hypothetical protein